MTDASVAKLEENASRPARKLWQNAVLHILSDKLTLSAMLVLGIMTLLCILGAVLLIATGVGSWRIMLATLIGAIVTSSLFVIMAPGESSYLALAPHWHIVIGGFAFGLVYMATDPVSAAQTNSGKVVYGFFIGVTVIIIRAINPAYPEGMMLAILFMNAFAPLIDHYVIQGHIARRKRRVATV